MYIWKPSAGSAGMGFVERICERNCQDKISKTPGKKKKKLCLPFYCNMSGKKCCHFLVGVQQTKNMTSGPRKDSDQSGHPSTHQSSLCFLLVVKGSNFL